MTDLLFAGSMAAAFAAGAVAFFAPCCAGVMMPAYLAAIGGGHRFRIARLTAVYVAGVSLHPVTEGDQTLVQWWADFRVEGAELSDVAKAVGQGVFAAGLAALDEKLRAAK